MFRITPYERNGCARELLHHAHLLTDADTNLKTHIVVLSPAPARECAIFPNSEELLQRKRLRSPVALAPACRQREADYSQIRVVCRVASSSGLTCS